MRVFEGLGDLPGDGQRLLDRQRPLPDALRQRRTFDQFQHERVVLQAIDRRDVGMVERGRRAGLLDEPGAPVGGFSGGGNQHLDGDETSEAGILRFIDLTHASGAQFFQHGVMRDGTADHKRRSPGS